MLHVMGCSEAEPHSVNADTQWPSSDTWRHSIVLRRHSGAAASQRHPSGNVLGCSEHLHTALQPQQKLMTVW